MADAPADREALEVLLGHPVDVVLPPTPDCDARVAVSRTDAPVRVRAAWVSDAGDVVARLGCPPGVPSPVRPIIATVCEVSADGVSDRLLLGRATSGVAAVRAAMPDSDGIDVPVHGEGIVAGRIPAGPVPIALDAIAPDGESIGRLMHSGITEMALVAGRIEGRLGATHGMAAGFGAGDTVESLEVAQLEAGYTALLPAWLPEDFEMTTVRVEPEAAYPFAPPSIAVAWAPGETDARVLLRQCPGPLASPETPDERGVEVDIGGVTGVMRARGMAFLVWERGDRAFGLQVRGTGDPAADALAIAESIPASPGPMP
jgi:hypothetical protein